MVILRTRRSQQPATVICRKVFTWIFVLVYGVPASLGPHWHQHGSEHAAELHAQLESVHSCSVSCCNSVQLDVAGKPQSRATGEATSVGSSWLSADNCFCAICAYYAQAVYSNVETSIESHPIAVGSLNITFESPWLLPILRANSRGPPTA